MAKLPKDLKLSTWKEIKPATLTETGVSDAIRKWEAAEKVIGAAKTRSNASFKSAMETLKALDVQFKLAAKKANSVVHSSALKALKEYSKLVWEREKALNDSHVAYVELIEKWRLATLDRRTALDQLVKEQEKFISENCGDVHFMLNQLINKVSKSDPRVEKTMQDCDRLIVELKAFEPRFKKVMDGELDAPCHEDDVPGGFKNQGDICREQNKRAAYKREQEIKDLERIKKDLSKIE